MEDRLDWHDHRHGKGLVERQGIEFHPLNFQGMRGRGITGMDYGRHQMLKAIWGCPQAA